MTIGINAHTPIGIGYKHRPSNNNSLTIIVHREGSSNHANNDIELTVFGFPEEVTDILVPALIEAGLAYAQVADRVLLDVLKEAAE